MLRSTLAMVLCVTATVGAPRGWACGSDNSAAATEPCGTDDILVSPSADRKTTLPRFQGPGGNESAFAQELWGFTLVGSGVVLGGLGFFTLDTNTANGCSETDEDCVPYDRGRTQLGATLLIGGIFLTGVGIYLVANADPQPRIIILDDDFSPNASFDNVSFDPVEGGGVVRSQFSF
ncbi:MAG: hypothetical protein AAFX99_15090 [Myxococcota bacterium]